MLPIRLEIKNFLAYRAPEPLRFDGIHLACLTGPNGAGKSSLLDAISWALWGKSRAHRDEELIHQGQNDMQVQLDFEQESVLYRVVRRRTRKGSVGTLDLYAQDEDGNWNNIGEPSKTATQDKITRLLRLDYDTFVNSAFLQQGKADAFTTKTPTERKRTLSDILGLERWKTYEDAAKARLDEVEREIKLIDDTVASIDNDLRREVDLRHSLEAAEKAQDDARQALEIAEIELEKVMSAPGDHRAALSRKAEQEQLLRKYEGELERIRTRIKTGETRVAGLEATLNQRADIERGFAELQQARQDDQTLGDKLSALKTFDEQKHKLEMQIAAERGKLESDARETMGKIGELQRRVDEASPDELSQVQADVMGLQAMELQRETLRETLAGLREERASCEMEQRTLTTQGNQLKDRIARLKEAEGATCPLCGQPLDADSRLELIARLDTELVDFRAGWASRRERIASIEREITDGQKMMDGWERELMPLAKLREREGALRERISKAEAYALEIDAAQATLTAVQAALANEDYAHDLRAELNALLQQREEIGYDSDRHRAARARLDTYRDYEKRQAQLEVAEEQLPAAHAELDEAIKSRDDKLADIEGLKAQIALAVDEIAALEEQVRIYNARNQEVMTLRQSERKAYDKLVSARQELHALEGQRQRKTTLEARREVCTETRARYSELREAFSKNGIPAMMIETAIPELENTANRLLARMTDGRMSLKMETQREKITGGMAETLDIHIADELGTRSYETFSGGEAFRINFAVRVALSQLLARRAGAHLRTLFIDEGFGTQDEDGRSKLVEAITAVQDEFALILVVTHIDDLRDSFPVHIQIDKHREGSHISVR
jgi:DNA repair protein SbcC/Rad50